MALPTSGQLGANLIMAEFGFPASTEWAMSTDGAAWISFTVGSQIAQSDFYGASAGPSPPFTWRSVGSPAFNAYQWTATATADRKQFYTPDNSTGTGVTQPSASASSWIYNVLYLSGASTWQQETSFDWASSPASMTAVRTWSNVNWRWNQFPDPNASVNGAGNGSVPYTSGSESVFWDNSLPRHPVSVSSPIVSTSGKGGVESQAWAGVGLNPGIAIPKTYVQAQSDPFFAFRHWNTPFSAHNTSSSTNPPAGLAVWQGTSSVTRFSFGSSFEVFIEFKFD